MISKYIIPRSTSLMSADKLCHVITMASVFQSLSFRRRSRTITVICGTIKYMLIGAHCY